MIEIDDKTFAQIVCELDSYLEDDDLVECVERAIVALNRFRNQEDIPILGQILDEVTDEQVKMVKAKLEKLNNDYKNDKWIN